jgi:transposase-like protein
LDILVQSRRSAKSAEKFFRRLRKGLRSVPRVMVTDKLRSYEAAHRVAMLSEDELKPIPAKLSANQLNAYLQDQRIPGSL